MGAMIEFARPDGGKNQGLSRDRRGGPAGHRRDPGMVAVSTTRSAASPTGLRAPVTTPLPRDLYKGRLTAVPDEANHLMSNLNFPRRDASGPARGGAAPESDERQGLGHGVLHGRAR